MLPKLFSRPGLSLTKLLSFGGCWNFLVPETSDLCYETPDREFGTLIVLPCGLPEMADEFLVNGFCLLSTPDAPGTPAASWLWCGLLIIDCPAMLTYYYLG